MRCDLCGECTEVTDSVESLWFSRSIVRRQRTCSNGHAGVTYEVPIEILRMIIDTDSLVIAVNRCIEAIDSANVAIRTVQQPGAIRWVNHIAFADKSGAMP